MFNTGTIPYSVPVAPLATGCTDGCNRDGWGDNGAWWIIVFVLFFAFGGWGGNGYGNGYTDAAIQRGFDNQAVVSKLDGINNGICSLGYDQLAQMNGINTNILQTGFGIQQAINADTVSGMQNTNAIQSTLTNMAAQNASCCCETQRQIERGFADTNYNIATQACETRQAIADSTRQVIDFLTQDKIATLTAENNDLRRAASQDRQNALLTTAMTAQTNQIINAVNPTAIPAYVVPNPNAYAYGCGCNQSCGC